MTFPAGAVRTLRYMQDIAILDFLGQYLFGGSEGRAAGRKVDNTIRRLPGFASVKLLEAWIDRSSRGGRNEHCNH